MKKTTSLTIALLATVFVPTPSFADDHQNLGLGREASDSVELVKDGDSVYITKNGDPAKTDWTFTLGIGTLYMPAFTGSKDYQLMAFPNVKAEYKDRLFISLFEGIGYNIIKTPSWRAGPIAKFDFGRQEDDSNPFRIAGKKSNALRGLGDIDPTAELGGFVEYSFDPISFKVELRQGVGGHKGLIGEISLDYSDTIDVFGPPIFFGFGPRATFADSHYNNAYFGITRAQSTASGLARYNASSGLVSYGVGGFAMMQVSDNIAVNLFAGYDRLGDQAEKSPLIRERGSVNQFTLGIGVSYQFGY